MRSMRRGLVWSQKKRRRGDPRAALDCRYGDYRREFKEPEADVELGVGDRTK
jgi:hypothetical protein